MKKKTTRAKKVTKTLKEVEKVSEEIKKLMEDFDRNQELRWKKQAEQQAALPKFDVLGAFMINSNKLRITDPCYDRNTWCAGTEPCVKGNWTGAIRRDKHGGVADLVIWHESSSPHEALAASDESGISVGVDSGQISFFDDALYPGKNDEFYDLVCEKTLGRDGDGLYAPRRGGGIFHYGVVSQTAHGDGSYTCYVKRDKRGAVVAARIATDD